MKRHVIETLSGMGISLLGFVLAFLNISDINNASFFSSSIAFALVVVGVVILFRAGRRDRHAVKLPPIGQGDHEKSLMGKHNEYAHTYAKTSQMRDKLKVIKHSGRN